MGLQYLLQFSGAGLYGDAILSFLCFDAIGSCHNCGVGSWLYFHDVCGICKIICIVIVVIFGPPVVPVRIIFFHLIAVAVFISSNTFFLLYYYLVVIAFFISYPSSSTPSFHLFSYSLYPFPSSTPFDHLLSLFRNHYYSDFLVIFIVNSIFIMLIF